MCPATLPQGAIRLQRLLCFCPLLRRIAHACLAWSCVCLALCAVFRQPAYAESGKNFLEPRWIYMPAGARATYIGIHGGTVPVSLLTSRDGTHLVALVGQTGNDFLRTLKVASGTRETQPVQYGEEATELAHLPLLAPAAPIQPFRLAANATLLMAGTAVGAMPVVYATGHSFAGLSQLYTGNLLFGISENSLLLEGAVKAPYTAKKGVKTAKRRLVRGSSAPVNE